MGTPLSSKVLVVDDNDGNRYALAHSLRQAGHQVLEAATGKECLRMVADHKPQLVLLDIKLPDLSGIEVCRQLKASPESAHIPVIHVSGQLTSSDNRIEGLESGADACLTTPVDPRELLVHVRALLRAAKAEAALRESEQRYRALAELSPDAFLVHVNGRYAYANAAAAQLFGANNAQELLGRSPFEFIDPVYHNLVRERIRRVLEEGRAAPALEYCWKKLDGSSVDVEVAVGPITWEGTLGVQVAARDITDRKNAERALRETTERFRSVLENSLDAAYRRDLRTDRYDYLSPVIEQVLGISSDRMRRMPASEVLERMHPEDRESAHRAVEAGFRSRKGRLEYRFRMDNGQYRWVADQFTVQVAPDGTPIYRGGTFRDITERKETEHRLLESRAQLQAALASMTDAVFISDAAGKFIDFNDAFATFHRFKNKNECPQTLAEYPGILNVYLPNGELATLEQWAVSRALRGETATDAVYRLLRKDTGQSWVGSYSFAPIRDKTGAIVGSVVAGRDITEQRRAEEALRQSEQRLRMAKNAAQIGIHDFSPVTGDLHWDERLRQLWGLDPADPVNYDVFMAGVHPDDRAATHQAIQGALDPAGDGSCYVEYRLVRGGHTRWIAATGQATFEGGRAVRFVGTVLDITHQKEFQAELERLVAERTEQLQELVRDLEQFSYSLAHDLRAPLRAMSSFSMILLDQSAGKLDEESFDYLKRIAAAAKRMDELIRDVLDYSKVVQTKAPQEIVDLDRLVPAIINEYPHLQPDQADIAVIKPLLPVLGNAALLNQCLSNLLGNAVKFAKPGRKPSVRVWTEERDKRVRVFIRDHGIGIAPDQHKRVWMIFERVHDQRTCPGTGIGLSIVKRAAEKMGGTVGLESEPGQGSTFWVELRKP